MLDHALRAARDLGKAVGHGNNIAKMILPESVTAVQIIQLNSHRDAHGNLRKWVDSININIPLNGTLEQRIRTRDSVILENENQRGGAIHWLNQD